jgi:hypothetical protein
VARAALRKKTADQFPEFNESQFLTERDEICCVVECDVGRGPVDYFNKMLEIRRIDPRPDGIRILDGWRIQSEDLARRLKGRLCDPEAPPASIRSFDAIASVGYLVKLTI